MNFQKIFDNIKTKSEFRKSVELQGVKYELSILSVDEEIKANTMDKNISDTEGLVIYETLKKQILSFAIRNIDGNEIPDIIELEEGEGDNKKVSRIERSLYLKRAIKTWNTYMVDSLFEVYIDVKEEASINLKKELKYNWFKEPEDRKKELLKRLNEKKYGSNDGPKEEPVENPTEDLKSVEVKENA